MPIYDKLIELIELLRTGVGYIFMTKTDLRCGTSPTKKGPKFFNVPLKLFEII